MCAEIRWWPAWPIRDLPNLLHLSFLRLFVSFEEVLSFLKQMGRTIREALDVIPERIGNGKAENLLIRSMLIPHLEQTHGFRLNNTAGERWLPNWDEGVEGVSVFR